MKAIAAFLRQHLGAGTTAIRHQETWFLRDGERLPATVYRPAGADRPLPAWVLLHGLTVRGRDHLSLDRFARALAASGAEIFVPEVPEWCRLRPAPRSGLATIRSAVQAVTERAGVLPDRIGLIGFSFGATQALMAATEPEVARQLRGIAAWGGYHHLGNLFRFGLNGEHELDGMSYRIEPDPYGRWVMGGNYLTAVPGFERCHALASALHELAFEAGRTGTRSWLPTLDPLKQVLRNRLPPDEREWFDMFAPPAGRIIADPDIARDLADQLAKAALLTDPLLDPRPLLPELRVPTILAHGRDDRLAPFTETIRLARALGHGHGTGYTITGLFSHSGGNPLRPRRGLAGEVVRFIGLLNRILRIP
jgi:pimeloyl-ACP methyl ester carboxylesterase